MERGTVVLFKTQGFGFIQPSDGTSDLYFHASELPGTPGAKEIEVGTPVVFNRATHRGKPVPRCVTPIDLDSLSKTFPASMEESVS